MCDKKGIRPLVAIEYDGSSHKNEQAMIVDAEKNRIFKEVGLPLVRIPNHGRVKKDEIVSYLSPVLSQTS